MVLSSVNQQVLYKKVRLFILTAPCTFVRLYHLYCKQRCFMLR